MILVLEKTPINEAAAISFGGNSTMPFDYYPLAILTLCNNKRLILLDVSAKGDFQQKLTGGILADWLIRQGLPKTVTQIDICIPELEDKRSIETITYDLLGRLTEKYNRKVVIRNLVDPNYTYVIPIPPQQAKSGKWEIYGLREKNELKLSDDQTFIVSPAAKILYCEETLDNWLGNELRVHDALTEYVIPYDDIVDRRMEDLDVVDSKSNSALKYDFSTQQQQVKVENSLRQEAIRQNFIEMLRADPQMNHFLNQNPFILNEMGSIGESAKEVVIKSQSSSIPGN